MTAIPGGRSALETLIAKWRREADTGFEDATLSPDEISTRRNCADDLSALLTAAGSAPTPTGPKISDACDVQLVGHYLREWGQQVRTIADGNGIMRFADKADLRIIADDLTVNGDALSKHPPSAPRTSSNYFQGRGAAVPAQAPAPTDLERYDAATVAHAKEREQEYRRTIWAAAAALWPNPLRVPQITRDAYTRSSEMQTRTDHATGDLLLFAPRPSLPVQE